MNLHYHIMKKANEMNPLNWDKCYKETKEHLKGLYIINPYPVQVIISTVYKYTGVSFLEMNLKVRKQEILIPRQIAMYFLYKMNNVPRARTLEQIARIFNIAISQNGSGHSTVIHSIKRGQEYWGDRSIKIQMEQIHQCLDSYSLIPASHDDAIIPKIDKSYFEPEQFRPKFVKFRDEERTQEEIRKRVLG